MTGNVCEWFLLFTLYSFLGWACESADCSIEARKWINRGFLSGPFCPIYGVGALLIVWTLSPFANHPVVLFFAGTCLTSVLEYVTGYLMEKLFHTRWWDYSHRRFNIKGRVCLGNAFLFGMMAIAVLYFVHPFLLRLTGALPFPTVPVLAALFAIYFTVDTALTVHSVLQLNGRLAELQQVLDEFRERTGAGVQERLEDLRESMDDGLRARLASLRARKDTLLENRDRLMQYRLIRAFPRMSSLRNNESLLFLKAALQNAASAKLNLNPKRGQKPHDN